MLSLILLSFLPLAYAKTDRAGCTWVEGIYTPTWGSTIAPWATRTWYVPDTGEICSRPDCGGGRAPVKTDVVGCDSYEGTSIYVPQFLDLESLKLETPSAVLLDAPPKTWTPSVTTTESSIMRDGESQGGASTRTGPTDEPDVEETEAAGGEDQDEGDDAAPTDGAAVATVGGIMAVVAGAAAFVFL